MSTNLTLIYKAYKPRGRERSKQPNKSNKLLQGTRIPSISYVKLPNPDTGMTRGQSLLNVSTRSRIRKENSSFDSLPKLPKIQTLPKEDRSLTLKSKNSCNQSYSFDSDLEKLEQLTKKNVSVRVDWLNIQERVFDLDLKRKLRKRNYDGEISTDLDSSLLNPIIENPVESLAQKYIDRSMDLADKNFSLKLPKL
jgi:hypothetical protein